MRTHIHNRGGFTLAVTMVFLILIVGSVEALIMGSSNGLALAQKAADAKRAYYVADAGIADAYIQLSTALSSPANFTLANPSYSVGGGPNGSYSVAVTGTGSSYIKTYTLVSTGTYKGQTKRLQLQVKQSALSMFAYLSNTEYHPVWGNLWWITGMTTVGPVRTNGALNIWGSPTFDGDVTQAGLSINYWSGGPPIDNPVWGGSLDLNAPRVNVPSASFLSSISSAAATGGQVLTGNSSFIFNSNGTVNITNAALGWVNHNTTLPTNGTFYVQGGSAYVEGTVNGQATVASDNQVYITGNILYNNDPRINPASTDVLGLVSLNNVTVTAASAPTNLEIDASMVALNGSFQVDTWWVSGKGNMIQFGSLMKNYCGPTGIFDPGSGTLYGGYNQLQYYDFRMLTTVPPSFPPASDSTGKLLYTKLGFKEL